MKTRILLFSPSSRSASIAQAIANGIDFMDEETEDATYGEIETNEFDHDTLAIVALPVYGGRVAPLALKRLENIRGQDTPAVAVVLYGNRHYGEALEQLADFLSNRGFRVIAAGTFIGEHSYSTPEFPIASRRPDRADLHFARQFGLAIKDKIFRHPDAPAVDVSTIEPPEQDEEAMKQFEQTVKEWMQQGVPMPSAPQVDASLCTGCNTCSYLCPTQAISHDTPTTTNADACIKCCACVKLCPVGARTFKTPFSPLLSKLFAKQKENKILL